VQDDERLMDERPTYVVMNGRIGSLTGKRALTAKQGETVRVYMGDGGPNLACSFHVIGEIFDRVYRDADLLGAPARNVQTTLIPPGGATVVEFGLEMPGTFLLVDHALSRLDKGAVGLLKVEGVTRPAIMSLVEAAPK
jgi:nitrite reductase (NO-forming)